ncbi:alpha/beta-hydrolase family protein [Gordonia sp. VNK21]|uniref:alpha/beta-hydrolase family protein n=1 Tax=Gordonia sp. VNK21 TaxID=3382483 RepID=UPI0038D46931
MTARPQLSRRPAALIGGGLGAIAALTPGAVPRSLPVSALSVAVAGLLGMTLGLALAAVTRRSLRPPRALIAAGLAVGAACLAGSVWWQQQLRAAMGMAPVSPLWVAATVAATLVPAVVLAVPGRLWAAGAVSAGLLVSTGALPAPAHGQTAAARHEHEILDYGALSDAPDAAGRAQVAVRRWSAHGGLDRRAVVLAVPTGSGWVDGAALDGFRDRFDGSVRTVAVQYADVPSWQAWLTDSGQAGAGAVALLAELSARLAQRPAAERPAIYLYGQSLGATGAEHARRWAHDHGVPVAGTVLAGVPGGGPAPDGCGDPLVLTNASDPVAALAPSLLWRPPSPPARAGLTRSASPQPPWLPGLSFLARGLDLLDALHVPVGHGHRYGTEQGRAVPDPDRCQPAIGPRAAS